MNERNTEEATDKERHMISLVLSEEQAENSIPLRNWKGEVIAHYQARAHVPKEALVKYYGSEERFNKAIRSGLESARASYNEALGATPKITVVPSKNPGWLEVTPYEQGEEPFTIHDGMWEDR